MNLDQPTSVRHRIVGVTALMAVLLYLDRFCISFAEIYIKQDLGLSDVQVGWMLSAFFWTYALGQVPSGWLSDRFGARVMLTLYILLWSAFTALTGLATGFVMLLALRFGFGIGQAGAYPTSASIISKWVVFTSRGTASSVVSVGGRVGGALAPLLTGYLIVAFVGVEVDSKLRPDDIIEPESFAETVMESSAERSVLAHRIAGRLRQINRPLLESVAAGAGGQSQREQLAGAMNILLSQRDLVKQDLLEGVPLETQARRLLAMPRESLSAAEIARLNRLALEAVFPAHIKRVYVAGWRKVMWVYGVAGLAVALLCWIILRDRPDVHPRCNKVERALIKESLPSHTPRPDLAVARLPLGRIVMSGSLWLSAISQFFTNFGWVFLVTWLPRYLENVHQAPVETRAWMTMTPILIGWIGMVGGGRLTDWLVGKVGLRWGRALPLSISRFVACAAYVACLFDLPAWGAVAAFSVVAFSTDLGTGALWAFSQDIAGRYTGSVLGWGNMWGNLGAAVTPPMLIWIVGEQYNWNLAFMACAGAFLCSGIAALGINAEIPIDEGK